MIKKNRSEHQIPTGKHRSPRISRASTGHPHAEEAHHPARACSEDTPLDRPRNPHSKTMIYSLHTSDRSSHVAQLRVPFSNNPAEEVHHTSSEKVTEHVMISH